ncbi:MAG: hypothetical protein U0169_26990 [Polyangiaceae bacterium]
MPSTTTQATGSVWLHASSDGEAAQESDDLQGAVFTHSWLNGLRGAADANGDSRVTLDESFAFAHAQTMIRSSESSGVLQKPEAVMNLRELAPVVLTETARKLSGLGLPPGKDVHYLVYTRGTKSVFAELWGSSGRATELRVPKGRYVVFRRSGSTGALAEVALADGESRELAYGDFRPASLDVLAQKGWDTPDDPRNEVTLGYVVTSNVNFGVLHGPSLAYARAVLPRVAIVGGVDGFFGARAFDANEQSMAGAMGRVAVEPRLELGRFVTLRGGLGGRAGVLVQTLTRTDAARVASDGYVTSRTEAAFAGGPEAYVGLRGATASSMSKAFFVDVALTGNVLLYRENGKTTATPSAGVGTQIGTRF